MAKPTTKKAVSETKKKEISETATKIMEKEDVVETKETAKKVTAAKAAPATKAAPAAKKAETPAKEAEKTEEPAKKTAAKKAPAKKEVVKSAFIQDNYGNSKTFDDITAQAIANFKETHKRVAVAKIEVYIKAAENKVYYVVNDNEQGEMNLF